MLGPIVLALLVTHAGVSVAPQATATQPPVAPSTQAKPDRPWPPAGVSRVGAGTTAPRVLRETRPKYTREAREAQIQGAVMIEAIVEKDGTVGEVRVARSLDKQFGLDQQAIDSVKTWQFAPGKKDGVAVPVMVEIEITFTLR